MMKTTHHDCSETTGMRRLQGRRLRIASDGATPLSLASGAGHLEVVRLLCEAGASVHRARPDGFQPLALAVYNSHLLSHGLPHPGHWR
eukprot:12435439-Heterocapsa_arctica.AAC.1